MFLVNLWTVQNRKHYSHSLPCNKQVCSRVHATDPKTRIQSVTHSSMQIAFVTSFTVLVSLPGNRGIPEHPSRHVLLTPGAPRSPDQPSPQARVCPLRAPGEDPEAVEGEQRSEDEGQSVGLFNAVSCRLRQPLCNCLILSPQ